MIETQNRELITSVISSFTRENDSLVDLLLQIQYYFRGSYSREDVWALSPAEREKSIDFLNKRFKDAGEMMKKQIPVFI